MAIYRSSVTGRIVSRLFAEHNPDTTEKEEVATAGVLMPPSPLAQIEADMKIAQPEDTAEIVMAGYDILCELRAKRIAEFERPCTPGDE